MHSDGIHQAEGDGAGQSRRNKMPEFALYIDKASVDLVTIQEYNERRNRAYYLLQDNSAVRVTVRGADIKNCIGQTLAVIAGFEECWGLWQANAHLKGRKTYVVTVFSEDVRDGAQETFSAWLWRNYLALDAPFREAGEPYSTPVHSAEEK
jgi:hypothetical protein